VEGRSGCVGWIDGVMRSRSQRGDVANIF
jgi:hypothetical protein